MRSNRLPLGLLRDRGIAIIASNNSEIGADNRQTFWFDQIEKYPQLYEMSREKYLDQKRKERVNQIALQGSQQ